MLGITHWIALLVAAGLALVATTAVVIPGKGAERLGIPAIATGVRG